MFRHPGKARTFRHNIQLAAFLSFTAGLVNICGVLALGVLTTNVTGHFAYFAENVMTRDVCYGIYFLLYILAFLVGSFVSNLLTEYFTIKKYNAPHNAAMFLEIFILFAIGFYGAALLSAGISKALLACTLLFAMGLQNSLVSRISNSRVRTTHLTGLFTDLGIELSQLFFYTEAGQRRQLLNSITLRCSIIAFFFAGCFTGRFIYLSINLKTLVFAGGILIIALVYDNIRLHYYKIRKRLIAGHNNE